MRTVLFSMFLTNMFLIAIVVVLDITLNKQMYRIVENRILIDKVINLVLQESVLKELCNKNIGKRLRFACKLYIMAINQR